MKFLLFTICLFFSSICFGATFETLTVGTSSVVKFTPGVLASAKPSEVLITTEQDIRFLYSSNGTPTASVGHLLGAGRGIVLENKDHINTFRMIAVSGTATVTVTYAP